MAGLLKVAGFMWETTDLVTEYRYNRKEKERGIISSAALTGVDAALWAVAGGIMGAKMGIEMAAMGIGVYDSVSKNNSRVYDQEMNSNGELGGNLSMNNIQQNIGSAGFNAVAETQRNLNRHFGDEARRYSMR